MAQFIGARQQKKPSTHLLSVTQRANESLRDYVVCFNTKSMQIEGYSDGVTLTMMIAGLKPRIFLWSLSTNPPRTYIDLLRKTKRYSSAEELYSARHGFEPSSSKRLSDLKKA